MEIFVVAHAHVEIDTGAARVKILALIDFGTMELLSFKLLVDMYNHIIKAK